MSTDGSSTRSTSSNSNNSNKSLSALFALIDCCAEKEREWDRDRDQKLFRDFFLEHEDFDVNAGNDVCLLNCKKLCLSFCSDHVVVFQLMISSFKLKN